MIANRGLNKCNAVEPRLSEPRIAKGSFMLKQRFDILFWIMSDHDALDVRMYSFQNYLDDYPNLLYVIYYSYIK